MSKFLVVMFSQILILHKILTGCHSSTLGNILRKNLCPFLRSYFLYVFTVRVCLCVQVSIVSRRSHKRVLDSPGAGVTVVVTCLLWKLEKKNRSSERVANVLSVFPALKMPFLVTPINWSMDMFLKYGFCRFFFSWLSTFLCQVCWFMQDDLQVHMLTFSVTYISRGSVILFPSRQWLEAGIPPRSSHFFE